MNNGGPAFPEVLSETTPTATGFEKSITIQKGMSMRDYFAAKAMQGMAGSDSWTTFKEISEKSYQIADEMLKARERNETNA